MMRKPRTPLECFNEPHDAAADTDGPSGPEPIRQAGLCESERFVLDLIRLACLTMGTGSSDPLKTAYERAKAFAGMAGGRDLVGSILALLRALRSERSAIFSFMSPECLECRESICVDELQLMSVIAAAREGNMERLYSASKQLTGHEAPVRLMEAARTLAWLLDKYPGRARGADHDGACIFRAPDSTLH